MYGNLKVFNAAGAMALHAGARQAVVAVNIANADTPGFKAKTIAPFAATLRQGATVPTRITRPGHMTGTVQGSPQRATPAGAEPSPNGNDVNLDLMMLEAVEVGREHSRALAIYRHALGVIRTSISR